MSTLTAKGLELDLPGDGTLKIKSEGKIKKFVENVFEKTFSGDEAVRRGQEVLYVTERAVFRRSARSETLELIEIAPGIDVEKDIVDAMEFIPGKCGQHLSSHTLVTNVCSIYCYALQPCSDLTEVFYISRN
jgi:acyl CoA:acetate/3-ketoacid CoA transferase